MCRSSERRVPRSGMRPRAGRRCVHSSGELSEGMRIHCTELSYKRGDVSEWKSFTTGVCMETKGKVRAGVEIS